MTSIAGGLVFRFARVAGPRVVSLVLAACSTKLHKPLHWTAPWERSLVDWMGWLIGALFALAIAMLVERAKESQPRYSITWSGNRAELVRGAGKVSLSSVERFAAMAASQMIASPSISSASVVIN